MGKSKKKGEKALLKPRKTVWILGLCLAIVLSLFFHIRELYIEMLEIDSRAKGYIVAQVDFSFPDPDATLVLKQEAFRDIGKIYRLDDHQIDSYKSEFESYLIHYPLWRDKIDETFDEVYNCLEALCQTLKMARITDNRTFNKREELRLSVHDFYAINNVFEGSEVLGARFYSLIKNRMHERYKFKQATVSFVIDYFTKKKFKVLADSNSQRVFKELIEKSIPEKLTRVKAGSRIIDHGETVSSRHIAMLRAMKNAMSESQNLFSVRTILSSIMFALMVIGFFYVYLLRFHKEIIQTTKKLSLFVVILLLMLILSKVCEWFLLLDNYRFMEFFRYPIFVPFATILLAILLDSVIALVTSLVLTVIMGITLSFDHSLFLFMNMITSITAAFVSRSLKKRREIFGVVGKIWLCALLVIIAFNLDQKNLFTMTTIYDGISSFVCLFVIALLGLILLPIFESLFNIMTGITLMEYMDPTNPLLKRLSMEAPGTYQHSLSIGHISEYVATAIGCDGLFCRVTTLYHDIGKLNNPHYYTENQHAVASQQFNIHQLLTPIESSYIIKSHIQDGIILAEKYKLPKPFLDIIREHHGTTRIEYFYQMLLSEMQGDKSQIDENVFRYPGPKPQTKESAIIMLADAVEATSRTLDDGSKESIEKMVSSIINARVEDGQFDECPLTFEELYIIRKKLVDILQANFHLRIKYPKAKESETLA